MAVTSKWIAFHAFAGTVINFQAQTGFNRPMVVSLENIKKLLDQKALIIEMTTEGDPIVLTEDNYTVDNTVNNHAVAVDSTAVVTPDLDAQAKAKLEALQQARLDQIKQEYLIQFAEQNIYSDFDIPSNVTVSINCTEAELLAALPTTVTVIYENTNTEAVPVVWDISTVDRTKDQSITVYGEFQFLSPKVQNPDEIQASVTVKIDSSGFVIGNINNDETAPGIY